MTAQTFCYPETTTNLKAQVMDISLQQQNEIIQCALKCLENRINYHSNPLTSPQEVRDYMRLQLSQEKNEIFVALFLDTQHRILAFEKLFQGTVDSATVHARVIIQRVLIHNAAAIIFAHNHPSGNYEPSASDKEITKQLKKVLEILNVRVLDHFIVSMEGAFSFAESGLL